jgi:thiol-disulfide isomerase/thioredoxin
MRWCKFLFVGWVTVLQHVSLLTAQDATATKLGSNPSDAKPPTLTAGQIARGQAIQQLLVRGIDFAREHGDWPQNLAELKIEKLPTVEYGPPAKLDTMDRNLRSRLRAISPVCFESFEDFHAGIWVGYADGHIEMIRGSANSRPVSGGGEVRLGSDQRALITTLRQFKRGIALVEKSAAVETVEKQPAQKADARLLLKITDEKNRPVAGAQVGGFLWNSDYDVNGKREGLTTLLGDKVTEAETTSDAEGHVEIRYDWFFDPDDAAAMPTSLVVFHKDPALMAIVSLKPTVFARLDGEKTPSLDVKLQRVNAVSGTLSRVAAPLAAGESKFTNVYVYALGDTQLRPMASMSKNRQFNFLLPPGDYLLHAYGDESFNTDRYLHLDDLASTTKLEIDLPADSLTGLIGKPAPELRGIKAWKDGKATTLAELRGKWVLVDFWGFWCGPCIAAMPELMKLHDELGDKGLAIVAVHDGSVESLDELNQFLAPIKQQAWNGRDLPFFVALDGGGELPISGTERSVKGATHAAYGVQHWPTTVLIDPNGVVLGERDAHSPELRKFLEEKLNPVGK